MMMVSHFSLWAQTLFLCIMVVRGNTYIAYKNGEPVHFGKTPPPAQSSVSCNLKCANNGVLSDTCSCKCPSPWQGKVCSTCDLLASDCRHGSSADPAKCTCTNCPAPWSGALCDTCGLSASVCKNGGVLDPDTCKCQNCRPPWGGPTCEDCLRPDAHCQFGSSLNSSTCQCTGCPASHLEMSDSHVCGVCPYGKAEGSGVSGCANLGVLQRRECVCTGCAEGYSGPACDRCSLTQADCAHGSSLSPKAGECACSVGCPSHWGGPRCDTCGRGAGSCVHGGTMDPSSCRCKGCDPPYQGELCNTCSLSASDCQHGGSFCASKCRCVRCSQPWTGLRCDSCSLTAGDCVNGTLDSTQCACKCTAPWGGDRCTVCALTAAVCGDGARVDADKCACVPTASKLAATADEKAIQAAEKAAVSATTALLQVQSLRAPATAAAATPPPAAAASAAAAAAATGSRHRCVFNGRPDVLSDYTAKKHYFGRTRKGYFQHLFTRAECSNGLPSGRCLAARVASFHCGAAQQWSVLSPSDVDGPGVMWYNDSPCEKRSTAANITVDYFCPSQADAAHLHSCVFQGRPQRLNDSPPRNAGSYGLAEAVKTGTTDGMTGSESRATFPDPSTYPAAELCPHCTAPGWYIHKFTAAECSSGLPPSPKVDRSRRCFVSMRWGEHCGGDHDWTALDADQPGAVWYTSHECSIARVAVDYYCPPGTAASPFALQHHRCTYNGAGKQDPSCTAEVQQTGSPPALRHANSASTPEGRCLSHAFTASECSNGLPSGGASSPGSQHCVAALKQTTQCGQEQDFRLMLSGAPAGTVGGAVSPALSGASVHWFNSQACGDATVVADFFCPASCGLTCTHGGRLNPLPCTCTCPSPWTGADCSVCPIAPSQCLHGTTLDVRTCTCRGAGGAAIWGGPMGATCLLTDSVCGHGGRLNKGTCSCRDCAPGWGGPRCDQCTLSQAKCKRGSRLNQATCACDIACPAPHWGQLCDRCPRGTDGRQCSAHGRCRGGDCVCSSSWTGQACSVRVSQGTCTLSSFSQSATFDGAKYTWAGRGESVLYQATDPSSSSAPAAAAVKETVYVLRSGAPSLAGTLSAVSGVALRRGGTTIAVLGSSPADPLSQTSRVLVDCMTQPAGAPVTTANGLSLKFTGVGYTLTSPSGLTLRLNVWNYATLASAKRQRQLFNVVLDIARPADGTTRGQCGDFDGSPSNDFAPSGSAQAHAQSWAVPEPSSAFACAGAVNVPTFCDGLSTGAAAATATAAPRFRSQRRRTAASSAGAGGDAAALTPPTDDSGSSNTKSCAAGMAAATSCCAPLLSTGGDSSSPSPEATQLQAGCVTDVCATGNCESVLRTAQLALKAAQQSAADKAGKAAAAAAEEAVSSNDQEDDGADKC